MAKSVANSTHSWDAFPASIEFSPTLNSIFEYLLLSKTFIDFSLLSKDLRFSII